MRHLVQELFKERCCKISKKAETLLLLERVQEVQQQLFEVEVQATAVEQ